jgi:hypothetical protein
LPKISCLFERNSRFAFDQETVEIFLEQGLDGFGKIADDVRLQMLDLVENGQSAILKDRVSVDG